MTGYLKRRKEFERVYSNHYRYPGKCFVILVHREPGTESRAGIVVGRKVGKAVVRNTVKRRVRALLRELPEFREIQRDLLIIARPSAGVVAWKELREELEQRFGQVLSRQ